MKLCGRCGERESVINLTKVEGGEVHTLDLCAKCAAEKGIQAPIMGDTALGGLLAALGGESSLRLETADVQECPQCGASLQDFRESGRLGCATCYIAFAEPLRGLLRRLHGSAHHTGRMFRGPANPSSKTPDSDTVDSLRERLRRAVLAEQFELAAELRDLLKDRE